MSRIGIQPVEIPSGVTVTLNGKIATVKGPKGTLQFNFHELVSVEQQEQELVVKRSNDEKLAKSLHGLTRKLLFNMVEGVTQG